LRRSPHWRAVRFREISNYYSLNFESPRQRSLPNWFSGFGEVT
jgi:hypothetical protein